MPTVATAVPETHADVIRARLLLDDPEQIFVSTPYSCERCGTPFVLFFVDGADERNDGYAETLRERIVAGCDNGHHPFEGYPLARP
jgi:hypothetical protein